MKTIPFFGRADKGVLALAVSQFGMAFSCNFVLVIMPFFLMKISPLGPRATMLWIGMILGGASMTTAVTAPLWGGLTARISPKMLFERGLLGSAMVISLIGFANSLYVIFALRLLQGIISGVSTVGFVLVSSMSPPEKLRSHMSLFQNAITAGQLLGPPAGAYAAAHLGYRAPFAVAGVVILLFLYFCHRHVAYVPPRNVPVPASGSMKKGLLLAWFLCALGTLHLNFLPAILPHILATFHLFDGEALSAAGIIMMTYTGSAMVGSQALCVMSNRLGAERVMIISLIMAALFQVSLAFSGGVRSFVFLRMLQAAFIAAVFPLTLSLFAHRGGGKILGLLNSARFLGNAGAPLVATSVLAYAGLPTVYLTITGCTLLLLWPVLSAGRAAESANQRRVAEP